MNKNIFTLSLLMIFSVFIVSCDKDDDDDFSNTAVSRGTVFPNKVILKVINKNDTTVHNSYTLYDTDGAGGSPPQIQDTIVFPIDPNASQATYLGELEFFTDNTSNNSTIRSNDTRYVVCYREFDFFELALNGRDLDGSGGDLGLNTEWIAKIKNRSGKIKITLNYNQQPKDGTCGAGSLIYEAYFPFRVE